MLTFPRLSSGAVCQFPLVRRSRIRTVINTAADGSAIKYPDAAQGSVMRWALSYHALSDEEAQTLRSFFELVEGRLKTFVFLDPLDNLLADSEELSMPSWARDPQIALADGIADPVKTSRASQIRNLAQAVQGIRQTISCPGWLQYCSSVYLRSTETAEVSLTCISLSTTTKRSFTIHDQWIRVAASWTPDSAAEELTFGIELLPGVCVEMYGLQVEAQPGASEYKRTAGPGGVYPEARLDGDVLKIETTSPGLHSCELSVFAAARR